jgi:hypothetical protein
MIMPLADITVLARTGKTTLCLGKTKLTGIAPVTWKRPPVTYKMLPVIQKAQ